MNSPRPPMVLVILDGFGDRAGRDANAVRLARTPNLDALSAGYPHTLIGTSGPDVGLPPGQMGNSEVGHMNFGAGRIAMMDISRIDAAVAEGSLAHNPRIAEALSVARARGGDLHLLGLVSDGGVHSSLDHLVALLDAAASAGCAWPCTPFSTGATRPRAARRSTSSASTRPCRAWGHRDALRALLGHGPRPALGARAARPRGHHHGRRAAGGHLARGPARGLRRRAERRVRGARGAR
jgi:hypothetical protein